MITNINVDLSKSCFDNFPLCFRVEIDLSNANRMTSISRNNDLINKYVNWNLSTNNVKESYDSGVGYNINELLTDELFICNEICGQNEIHEIKLDKILKDF